MGYSYPENLLFSGVIGYFGPPVPTPSEKVLSGPVASNFGIQSQAVTSVWARLSQVTMLRTCPNMTLGVKP